MAELVRYTAKLRGACARPLRLVASHRLGPVNRSDADQGHAVTSLQRAIRPGKARPAAALASWEKYEQARSRIRVDHPAVACLWRARRAGRQLGRHDHRDRN